ncbi:MAG: hypothetical protein ACTSQI_03270 [Candidatus Helarchaeota archaeon]
MSLLFEKKKVVIPGEALAEGNLRAGYGTYKDGNIIRSSIVGLPESRNQYVSVIPLQGAYISEK